MTGTADINFCGLSSGSEIEAGDHLFISNADHNLSRSSQNHAHKSNQFSTFRRRELREGFGEIRPDRSLHVLISAFCTMPSSIGRTTASTFPSRQQMTRSTAFRPFTRSLEYAPIFFRRFLSLFAQCNAEGTVPNRRVRLARTSTLLIPGMPLFS
jgi:hypothetical protein